MKVFITFMGLIILQVGLITYEGELNYYMYAQNVVKEAAEECACGAALLVDEEAFVLEGKIVFDEEKGQEYADAYIENMISTALRKTALSAECELSYEEASVSALVTVKTKDLFTTPFINLREIKRESNYEYLSE